MQLQVQPGETGQATVTLTPSSTSFVQNKLHLSSNDPDEPLVEVHLFGGQRRETRADTAPEFNLNDLAGRQHRLSDFRGQVVLLAFFALW